MSYPVWPEELVQFERGGWQAAPQDGRRRSQNETGPPGFRRRFSATARRVDLALIVPQAGRARFWRFHTEDCAGGAQLFWMPDPSVSRARLLDHTGTPLLTGDGTPLLLSRLWLCLWGDQPPVESVEGDVEFRLTFSVWVMP
ncbi:hypothetical protein [Palleronia caenipelagi]|uniref:Uncharacterized protein n=1 Tax=Palleronia caenipelagi TaxID=2489174 RepID=A0A547PW27_9RHOB|nr:hypothetical protein [Palleronia caenipelagi]TRD18350.1 hypothetical protein FEV53_11890 [Palleronia caenipelagi]